MRSLVATTRDVSACIARETISICDVAVDLGAAVAPSTTALMVVESTSYLALRIRWNWKVIHAKFQCSH
jgi:hypothetical protein